MTDPNYGNLRSARGARIETFSGDILSEAAEHRLELVSYATIIAATLNDAYNTLFAIDLAPEFGRGNVFQVMREKTNSARHQLPRILGGAKFGPQETHRGLDRLGALVGHSAPSACPKDSCSRSGALTAQQAPCSPVFHQPERSN